MTRLLAIDPGPVESALLEYDIILKEPWWFAKLPNAEALDRIADAEAQVLAIEVLACYGMPVGAETFETAYAIGSFERRWLDIGCPAPLRVYRRDVKLHLCGSARAKDANIRQALIDRYGGKERAIGRKKTPGLLYGMSGDCWAALGVAITAVERGERKEMAA